MPAGRSQRTTLFRAVTVAELESIHQLGRFSNPIGIDCKYFAPSRAGAYAYAQLAETVFGEGLFVIVETSIVTAEITGVDLVVVDGGIESVVIRTPKLARLAPPIIFLI